MSPPAGRKVDLHGLDFQRMLALTGPLGGGPRVAGRILRSLYADMPATVAQIQGARRPLLEALAAVATIGRLTCREVLSSREPDPATKYVLAASDGALVETVTIPAGDRLTVCVSSQVGCRMGCTFCQTARMGLVRNLQAAEIVEQVVFARGRLPAGRRITNVVYMGMGEPLDNLEAVWQSLEVLQEQRGLAIPRNRVTVSTVGHLPGLERLAAKGVPVNLAISLNASSESVRSRIVPVSRTWPIERLLAVADRFPLRPGRDVVFEYVLLEGVNDRDGDADGLARLLAGRRAKVNVIAYNPVPGLPYRRPPAARVEEFARKLAAKGVWTTVRASRGVDVMGACGQLGRVGA